MSYRKSHNHKLIYERDGYKCRLCGSNDFVLNAHHLTPVELDGNHNKENLITLCSPCHYFMHANPMLAIKSKIARGEKIKKSLEARKEAGYKLGRPFGTKDINKRNVDGYKKRWAFERKIKEKGGLNELSIL